MFKKNSASLLYIAVASGCVLGASVFAQSPSPSSKPASTSAAPAKASAAVAVPATSLSNYKGAAFGGKVATIPGIIEMENFDEGVAGVAYYDRDPDVNNGGGYRLGQGVDIKGMLPIEGQKPYFQSTVGTPTIGWFFVGEWLHYTVDVTPGVYEISVRYATPIVDKKLDVYLDGKLLASIDNPKTGEYNIWSTAHLKDIEIPQSGRHLLRLQAAGKDLDECDYDWISFQKTH